MALRLGVFAAALGLLGLVIAMIAPVSADNRYDRVSFTVRDKAGDDGRHTGAEDLQKLREMSLGDESRRLDVAESEQVEERLARVRGPFVVALGNFTTRINRNIRLTFRYAPGRIEVNRGQRVTFLDAGKIQEPHTITVAERSKLPDNIDEVFGCRGRDSACGPARGHFATQPPTRRLNEGRAGLNKVGDSLLIPTQGSIRARVTATAGSTLHYLCVIHPWMQGHIKVN
jgi:plastocyanin